MVSYRLRTAILGVRLRSGEKPSLFTVPKGSRVEVTGESTSSAALVRVHWDDIELEIFRLDLDERADQVLGMAGD